MQNGRLQIIGRGETGCVNRGLLSVFPIIVRGNQRPGTIAQLKSGISQHSAHAELGQSWPKGHATARPCCRFRQ